MRPAYEMESRRDSWPPTQLRLVRSGSNKTEPRPLRDIDEDPLTYFLTPTHGNDEDYIHEDLDLDFDAGIESPGGQRNIVRSVSPSSLEGIRKAGSSDALSELDSDGITSDEDDTEDYIRFSPPKSSLLSFANRMKDNGANSLSKNSILYNYGVRSRSPVSNTKANDFLSPASFPAPAPAPRGRTSLATRRGLSRSMSARAGRAGHLWREPSPDVWSIEEEPEEERLSELGESFMSTSSKFDSARQRYQGLQNTNGSVKPKKKVRFLLPPRM